MKTQLTIEELQILINVVSQINVPVAQSPQFIRLIDKMSLMISEIKQAQSAIAGK